jgi:hypothetical protein
VLIVVLLAFLGVSTALLWAAHAYQRLGGTNTSRVTAAFVGIWFATVFGAFLLLLMGVSEDGSANRLGSIAAIAFGETFWLLATCGLTREASLPAVCAVLSIAMLIVIAAT